MTAKRLTDTALKALRPAASGQRYQVMDTEIPGFGVRVTDKHVRTFIFRTRYPGSSNPNRRALGEYPFMSLADAREKARAWRTLVKQGIDPAEQERREREAEQQKRANSFASVADDFIAEKLATERKGKEVARDIRRDFLPAWKSRPITEITDLDVLAIVKAKRKTAPAQARNLLGIAKRLFAWAVDQRVYSLAASPCDTIKAAKVIGAKKRRRRVLSDDELFALWRNAQRMPYPHGPVYMLLILAALRLNEAADARTGEFNLREDMWVIPEERMKGRAETASEHVVPLTAEIKAVLSELPTFRAGSNRAGQSSDYVFSTTFGEKPVWMSSKVKKRLDTRMLRTMKALARHRGGDWSAVKLAHWVNHDIRRTVRSQLSRLKISEEAREAVLAHARPGIKGTYDHYEYFDEKKEALELWAARLRTIVEPAPSNVVRLPATSEILPSARKLQAFE